MILIIDENLTPGWCRFLHAHDYKAIHWLDIGKPGDPDERVFEHARDSGAVILSQDLDFSRLLAAYSSALPSVIQLRVDVPTPDLMGNAVIQVLHQHQVSLDQGCLIAIEPDRHRIRLLPLQG